MSTEPMEIYTSRSLSKHNPVSPILRKKKQSIIEYNTANSPDHQEDSDKESYRSKLRHPKTINYNEQLDEVSLPQSSADLIPDETETIYLGSTTLPNNEKELREIIDGCSLQLRTLQQQFFEEEEKDESKFLFNLVVSQPLCQYPENSIPINTNVLTFDFLRLAMIQEKLTGQLFDVVMMDPPWQLSSSNPTRGVAIAYDTLPDANIRTFPFTCLQKDGFLFIWTINAKFSLCLTMMSEWGYTFIDDICWVKESVNGKIAKGHGYYLQHSKETCLVGIKGNPWKRVNKGILEDCIFSKRRGQSQKPNEIYDMIEELIPDGYYIEIFGRRNNLRNGWVTIGNEL